MALLDQLKRFFGRDEEHPDPAVVPPAPADPLGTTPGPLTGTTPPAAPPSAPRDSDEPG